MAGFARVYKQSVLISPSRNTYNTWYKHNRKKHYDMAIFSPKRYIFLSIYIMFLDIFGGIISGILGFVNRGFGGYGAMWFGK